MKPKIVTLETINQVDPSCECFIIKNTLSKEICSALVEYLEKFANENAENLKFSGENWHYLVRSNNNFFNSFLFNDLSKLNFSLLTSAYKNLFNLYNKLGESTFHNDFQKEIKISDFVTNYRTINPLVFYYFNQKSQFGFHKHDIRNQKFQLLTNLTQPKYDYLGGETWVYMAQGKPDLNDIFLEEKCVVFGEEFEIGDTFSFPYDKWHKVERCFDASYKDGKRVSLLMPLGARNNKEYKNEVL